ncbi:MAG: hypothetical protein HQ488_00680 [Parcubacteria group bacterium]|nr:hypothetical protein [Parcubacteria group bacterium]
MSESLPLQSFTTFTSETEMKARYNWDFLMFAALMPLLSGLFYATARDTGSFNSEILLISIPLMAIPFFLAAALWVFLRGDHHQYSTFVELCQPDNLLKRGDALLMQQRSLVAQERVLTLLEEGYGPSQELTEARAQLEAQMARHATRVTELARQQDYLLRQAFKAAGKNPRFLREPTPT